MLNSVSWRKGSSGSASPVNRDEPLKSIARREPSGFIFEIIGMMKRSEPSSMRGRPASVPWKRFSFHVVYCQHCGGAFSRFGRGPRFACGKSLSIGNVADAIFRIWLEIGRKFYLRSLFPQHGQPFGPDTEETEILSQFGCGYIGASVPERGSVRCRPRSEHRRLPLHD